MRRYQAKLKNRLLLSMVFVFLFLLILLSLWGVSVEAYGMDMQPPTDTDSALACFLSDAARGRQETAYMHHEHSGQPDDLSRVFQGFLILLSFLFALLNERYGNRIRQSGRQVPPIAVKLETSILSHSLGSNAPPLS
ncbi:hypothetical protein [Christensenella timonensis]|uniref:hypothetical protein n=1 Tax=Christensenella timonensis TaxID=1816678 RepID=UPI00082AA372|nr:hypothetical protein [Christensenella timonensis]